MQTIKFNYDFLDVPCKKNKEVMVGSITCKKCKHNKTSGVRMRYGGEIMCNYDEDVIVIGDREIVGWSCNENEERIVCSDKDEAIRYYFEAFECGEKPDKIKVYGFARSEIHDDGTGVLEDFLIWLDEGFGDPDSGWTEPSDKMKKAAKEFVDVVISEYEVWACDCVYEEEVDLKKWIEKNERKI
ncbi:MAG: hypothetical protein P8Y23_01885 [Candidatus Lokiarchaeota archaeon]